MKILFENHNHFSPKLSIILLDWSCRDSFHTLQYLSNQTVPRDRYQVIWIEYYNRESPEIENGLKECERLGKPPIVDKWIVMGMAQNIYYHKHLMFNIGIIASSGKIITFCDSDAMVKPTFVESIVTSFEKESNIVLHMDEVRNIDKRFYPFNYPSIEDTIGRGCVNWKDGKTTGLHDAADPLHTLNYGACMSALRGDLIDIGGADEHIDYLGHICGPYEMTFRLVNAGKKKVWHQEEFLYHTWHPGTDGKNNYLGPHDGRNMSTTALKARIIGRVMPIIENPAIKMYRLNKDNTAPEEELMLSAMINREIYGWEIENLRARKKKQQATVFEYIKNINAAVTFGYILRRQVLIKINRVSSSQSPLIYIFSKFYMMPQIIRNMFKYASNIYQRCSKAIQDIEERGITEIAICGTGDEARVLYKLINGELEVKSVFDPSSGKRLFDHNVLPMTEIKNYKGTVVVTNLGTADEILGILRKVGIPPDNIMVL